MLHFCYVRFNVLLLLGYLVITELVPPTSSSSISDLPCRFSNGLTVGDSNRELECCKEVYKNFTLEWAIGQQYLSTYLESLRGWKCPQFEQECKNRTFAFNQFSNLMYLQFCDREKLQQTCLAKLKAVVKRQTGIEATSWRDAVTRMNIIELTDNEILEPCIEIAMYESEPGGLGHYHEVIEPVAPFCSFIWCGFDEKIIKNRSISPWTCMPQSCRSSITAVMVFCGIFAVATIICNATVLAVLLSNGQIRNGQHVYRLSLAFADILVGIVVFPTFISTLWKYFIPEHKLGALNNVTGYVIENGTATFELKSVEMQQFSSYFSTRFSSAYLNSVGFFTILSLTVSVFTLVTAGFDRLIAVLQPLKYRQDIAIKIATVATLVIWILGLIFSTMPWYVSNLRYGVVSSILISAGGTTVAALYIIAFCVPLITMWGVTIATYVTAKRLSSEYSRMESTDGRRSSVMTEMRLAATLGIMISIFTICLLPTLVILVLGFVFDDIYYTDPANLNQQSATDFISSEIIVIILLMSNSLWNCFIYSIRDAEFRTSARRMFSDLGYVIGRWLGGGGELESQRQESRPISEGSNHSDENIPNRNGFEPDVTGNIDTTTV